MDFDRSQQPMDFPPPPTVDEITAQMNRPLWVLADQESIEEAGAGHGSQTVDGVLQVETVALSYVLWRYPADRADPRNLRELTPEERAGLEMEPVGPLPEWIIEARDRMRYPLLWEGVRTTHFVEGTPRPVEDVLAEHMNHILMNVFQNERVVGGFPGELTNRVETGSSSTGRRILLDGEEIEGMCVDTDPHVLGLGAVIGTGILTAAIPRDYLPYLRLEFITRPVPSA